MNVSRQREGRKGEGREGGKEREGEWKREEIGVWVHICAPAYNGTLSVTYNVHNTLPCLYIPKITS